MFASFNSKLAKLLFLLIAQIIVGGVILAQSETLKSNYIGGSCWFMAGIGLVLLFQELERCEIEKMNASKPSFDIYRLKERAEP